MSDAGITLAGYSANGISRRGLCLDAIFITFFITVRRGNIPLQCPVLWKRKRGSRMKSCLKTFIHP